MGFGDPYHKHPLRYVELPEEKNERPNCYHCELPITAGWNIGCVRCDYYIHTFCSDLPQTMWHPLHDKHPLTLSESLPTFSNTHNLCSECQNPCFDRFTYHCLTCQFIFHLKCFFKINHIKHPHPLIFSHYPIHSSCAPNCGICGLIVEGFNFACMSCRFVIHHECTLLHPIVRYHHVHELTLRYYFPEECNQVYCDRCEDRDGEMDCTLSYYYCKRCDYIAHVRCVTLPKEDAVLYKRFTHEHPLIRSRNPPKTTIDDDDVCGNSEVSRYDFRCQQCSYVVDEWGDEFPSLIKHPRHQEHDITFVEDNKLFCCTDCDFTIGYDAALEFAHPFCKDDLKFSTCNWWFRCDACGELGKGSSIGNCGDFDLHLECFALRGKLEHESHPDHPLYLCSDPKKVPSYDASTTQNCNVCNEEIDPELWIFCCLENDYVAHISCVASDLLSTQRSSIKNQPDFCAIIEPDKTSFEFQIAKIELPESIPISQPCDRWDSSGSGSPPPFLRESQIPNESSQDLLGLEELDDVLHCPKCKILISTEAKYSCIDDWESSHFDYYKKSDLMCVNDQISTQSEPLALLGEEMVDELYCPICCLLIFPPTYSCTSCQIFFHRSCAELPRNCPSVGELFYALVAPPFSDDLSNCSRCKYLITGYAYLFSKEGVIIDVQCALRAPLLKKMNHQHRVFCRRSSLGTLMCRACDNCIDQGTPLIGCPRRYCNFYLHVECALLPPVIKHGIHKHPLGLATDLAEWDDEYICDACEKDLNPNLWAYRCLDTCNSYATSHVTCVITSKKKLHFRYAQECQNMTEEQKIEFLRKAKARGIRK